MEIKLVTYIIPIFNVSDYIEKSVRSLLEQSYRNIEYIFINDCSSDDSEVKLRKTIEEFPERCNNIKIITNEQNLGSATSRNLGLDMAQGDYVMFSDSDDWVSADYVESMVRQIEGGYDIVYCNYFENFKDHEDYDCQNHGQDNIECIRAMLRESMHASTCNKIYRRSFLFASKQRFVDRADFCEDLSWNIRLFACTRRISYLPRAFYHYVKYNHNSITKSKSSSEKKRNRLLQRFENIRVACDYLIAVGFEEEFYKEMKELKLMAKNDLIDEKDDSSLQSWIETFPEADSAILSCNKITWKNKLLLLLLHYKFIWLYNLLWNIRLSFSNKN